MQKFFECGKEVLQTLIKIFYGKIPLIRIFCPKHFEMLSLPKEKLKFRERYETVLVCDRFSRKEGCGLFDFCPALREWANWEDRLLKANFTISPEPIRMSWTFKTLKNISVVISAVHRSSISSPLARSFRFLQFNIEYVGL